ncbi:MAG: prephenate dehydratase [Phycisphaerae bacterium]
MAESNDRLKAFRTRIDELDRRIVELLNERARVVIDVGKAKSGAGAATYVPEREREVLDRAVGYSEGPLSDQTISAIYRELMSGSLALEHPPRIAYLGPPGSFSHLAAERKFGASVEYESLGHISACFDEIERGRVDLAIVPVENSLGGGVADTLDAFVSREVKICAELNLAVHHYLLGTGPLEAVEKVYSKPEVFAQCQSWLMETGFVSKTLSVASTSKAAEMASLDPSSAAIAGKLAGRIFRLSELADRIEDDPNNVTRFLVLGKESAKPTGDDKTAVYFNAADRPGALVEVLDTFRRAGINMSFIQSRPSRTRRFDYAFFVDLSGHADDDTVASAIEDARLHCTNLKVLGSFPRSTELV